MAHLQFLVVNNQGCWSIRHKGQLFGEYPNQGEAISKAMEAAFSGSMSGHKTEVLTQGPAGEFKLVCTYGRDSHR